MSGLSLGQGLSALAAVDAWSQRHPVLYKTAKVGAKPILEKAKML